MLAFNKKYFLLALLIFVVEVLIAVFVHDAIIRPYVGDVLVVILMYCFIKAFLKLPVLTVAVFVLFFAFGTEFLQYLNIIEQLGLEKSKVARTVIGTSFSPIDLVTYIAGFSIILISERHLAAKKI